MIEYRTVEQVTPVYISIKNKDNKYKAFIQNNRLLIGYIIESTTGLLTDKTLCIYRFLESWLVNKNFINFINKHKNKTCIIDCYSDSWGKKKIVLGKTHLIEWVNEFLEEEPLKNPIIIKGN